MVQMPSWSFSLQLAAEPASASQARDFVCLHLLRHGLRHLEDDIRLVVSELVTNAITHARTPFTVVLQRDGPSVTLTVRDLSPLVPLMTAGRRLALGGRGLVIVDVVSSDWGVTASPDGAKSVWAAFAAEDEEVTASWPFAVETGRGPGARLQLSTGPGERRGEAVTGDGDGRVRIERLLLACIEAVGVDGGGMSLVSATGSPEPVYGSDDTAEAMERLQFTLGEGPCVDASTSGSPVLVADLDDPRSGVGRRWPMFLAEALQADVRAVFAFPVRLGAISLGAIDLYRRSPGPLSREDLATTLRTVDEIASAVLDLAGDLDAGLGGDHLSSMAVHRAAGMVMAQLDTSIEDALVRLRATAYAEGAPIQELADDVVSGERRFGEDRG